MQLYFISQGISTSTQTSQARIDSHNFLLLRCTRFFIKSISPNLLNPTLRSLAHSKSIKTFPTAAHRNKS
jgi:hypothetical protein